MKLHSLSLRSFRNYNEVSLEINDADIIFLIGKNGQGKTNFLEAIYCLSCGNSFRLNKDETMVTHGKDEYLISGIFDNEGIRQSIEIQYRQKKKRITLNDDVVRTRREIINKFPCVVFKHSDIFFVSGTPEYQRQYLDQSLILGDDYYLQQFQNYRRILKQKNMSLKLKYFQMIPVYNEQLIDHGMLITKQRKNFVNFISENITILFKKIFSEKLEVHIEYKPDWKSDERESILKTMVSQEETEKEMGFSLSGPHKDKIHFTISGYHFKDTASTGQLRLMSLLLKVTQALYYEKKRKEKLVYLFDDVLLELDFEKRRRFLSVLPAAKQSFFTFLPEEQLPCNFLGKKKIFFVEKGKITAQ